MKQDRSIDAFLTLVKAGLWENESVRPWSEDQGPDTVNWDKVFRLAEEQSVTGLVAAGIDWLKVHEPGFKVSQKVSLQFIGATLQMEQRNRAMNEFLAKLVEKLRNAGVYALLVKGQGIAQCYERPLWRASGDVDLFLSDENYGKAKAFLLPLGELEEPEESAKMHLSLKIGTWIVELHGTLRGGLSARVDRTLDEVKNDVFYGGCVRSWMNGRIQIFMPDVNCDVVYVFSHILQHFFKGGIGLRQICDWCRLLWTYRDAIDKSYLETRLKSMRLMSEWHAFAALAVDCLGMPADALPMYSPDARWKRKASRMMTFILEVGNFGHNRDLTYMDKYPYVVRKAVSAWRRGKDLFRHARIFPLDSGRFFLGIMFNGFVSALKGE